MSKMNSELGKIEQLRRELNWANVAIESYLKDKGWKPSGSSWSKYLGGLQLLIDRQGALNIEAVIAEVEQGQDNN